MKTIEKYFPNLNDIQKEQFTKLGDLYRNWNEKINVISRKDIDLLYERHVLHALAIAKFIRFKDNTSILDVGTGGGFPGIPLAIFFPKAKFHLIDAIGKKIKVVNAVIDELGLKNAKAEHKHSNELKPKFDFIVSRAVTSFPKFVELMEGKVKYKSFNGMPNGIIYLKGGDLQEELKKYRKNITIEPISSYFKEAFFETKSVVYYPL